MNTLSPPITLISRLKFLGPGMILSASIVGSGELIATTLLGAKAGFVALWVILLSCLIKVAIQLEFGKKAILSKSSLMGELNQLKGQKLFGSNWSIWAIIGLTFLKIFQLGGMLGGAAILLSTLFPDLSTSVSLGLLGISLPLFYLKNYYPIIEKTSMILVFGFTLFTLSSLFAIEFTPFAFSIEDILSGLKFQLPKETIFVAIGAFGITGVASDEIIAYFYWCQEKGYGKYVGEQENNSTWKNRAHGWISIMKLDAWFAMGIYTTVTCAFYLLGASILHGSEILPEGTELIQSLSKIYTESFGEGAKIIYLLGGLFALYSSVFATLGYWSRLFPDAFHQIGWIKSSSNNTFYKGLIITLPLSWVLVFLFVNEPGFMVLVGGSIGAVLLLVTLYIGINFRKSNLLILPHQSLTSRFLFWLSVVSILGISIYGLVKLIP